MRPLGVRNFGFGWDRIENVLWRVHHDELDGFDAEKIVLMIGTNNIGISTDDEIVSGLEETKFFLGFRYEKFPSDSFMQLLNQQLQQVS